MRLFIKFMFTCLVPLSFSLHAFDFRHGVVPVQLGLFGSSQGKAQNINIQGLIGDKFTTTVNNNNNTNGLFGIGYYVNGMEQDHFNLMYGLNGFYLGNTSVSGTIMQEHLFENLAYHYRIQHVPVYLAAKAKIKNTNEKYNIIVDAGIGPNFMQTNGYKDSSLDEITLPDHAFKGQNNVAFTVTAGIGLRLNNLLGKAPIECGYRFFYLGQGELLQRTNQILNTLKTGNNYANAVVCAVTV